MEKAIALPGGVYNFGSETTKSMYDITQEFIDLSFDACAIKSGICTFA